MAITLIIENGWTTIIELYDGSHLINTTSLEFLDWLRLTFSDSEGEEWHLIHYSGTSSSIVVNDLEIITMILLRWQ